MSGVHRLNGYGQVGRINNFIKRKSEDYWWLAGGINPANCIAAYQPIGAASYAASKVNLANPGTYDLVEVGAAPNWDSTIGWQFNLSANYFDTGIIPYDGTLNQTVIFRTTKLTATLLSPYNAGNGGEYAFYLIVGGSVRGRWWSGSNTFYNSNMVGDYSYGYTKERLIVYGATEIATSSPGTLTNNENLYIGRSGWSTSYDSPLAGFAFYNTTLTQVQINNVLAKLSAL